MERWLIEGEEGEQKRDDEYDTTLMVKFKCFYISLSGKIPLVGYNNL